MVLPHPPILGAHGQGTRQVRFLASNVLFSPEKCSSGIVEQALVGRSWCLLLAPRLLITLLLLHHHTCLACTSEGLTTG